MRIAFLFTKLAPYFIACLKTLKGENNASILVIHRGESTEAPFRWEGLDWIDEIHLRDNLSDKEILKIVHDFKPDAIFMSGWADSGYRQVGKVFKGNSLLISGIDTQWKGTLKQRLGSKFLRKWFHSFIDVFWVAGERQRIVAQKLGFTGLKCWSGLLTCDTFSFNERNGNHDIQREKAFLYVGRYFELKGIEILAKAYQIYRNQVIDPWKLIYAGTGHFQPPEIYSEGIEHLGFVQPEELPGLMARCSAFVLPSYKEAWGVVIHEAASSGLPLICTDACGAAVHLLQDSWNGYLTRSGSVEGLVTAMLRISELPETKWTMMSERSRNLARMFTLHRWVDTLIENTRYLIDHEIVSERH